MATSTLKADTNNDLIVVDGRNLSVIDGAAACLQNIRQKTLMRTTEDIYDIRNGVDYFGTIFSQQRDTDGARKSLTDAILSCPDTLSVEQLNIDVAGDTFNFEAQVMTIYGPLQLQRIGTSNKVSGGRPGGTGNLPTPAERVAAMVNSFYGPKAWFDPSDGSTLFQDAAGTIPVTAVEQPVGLLLDKSGSGNHAVATTDAGRPYLSARINEFTESEFRNGLADIAASGSVTAASLPGYQGAIRFAQAAPAAASYCYKRLDFVAGVTYTMSIVVRMSDGLPPVFASPAQDVGSDFSLVMFGNSLSNVYGYRVVDLGGGAFRIFVSAVSPGSSSSFFGIAKYITNNTARSFVATAYHIEARTYTDITRMRYQRITIPTEYDTKGFPVYLRGAVGTGLRTAQVMRFSGTPVLSANAAFRLSSSVGHNQLIELTPSYSAVVGAFTMSVNEVGPGAVAFGRRATTLGVQVYRRSDNDTAMPADYVVTAMANCQVLDGITLRKNGVEVTAPASLQGTSPSLADGQLFLMCRGNNALSFVGNFYGMLIMGRLQTAEEYANVEMLFRQKMTYVS